MIRVLPAAARILPSTEQPRLFEVTGVTPPLIEADDGEELLVLHYRTLPLAQQSAKTYVERGAVPMYGLLPVMQDTSDELLLKAIDEMVQWYGENESLLRDELLCFRVLLARAHRLPEQEMARVERRLRMFDPFLENDPWVKEKEARGEARGELHQAREMIVRFVQRRFPALAELARTKMQHANQVVEVNALMEQLWFAPDEFAARALLETTPLT